MGGGPLPLQRAGLRRRHTTASWTYLLRLSELLSYSPWSVGRACIALSRAPGPYPRVLNGLGSVASRAFFSGGVVRCRSYLHIDDIDATPAAAREMQSVWLSLAQAGRRFITVSRATSSASSAGASVGECGLQRRVRVLQKDSMFGCLRNNMISKVRSTEREAEVLPHCPSHACNGHPRSCHSSVSLKLASCSTCVL